MNIFNLHKEIMDDYKAYIESFVNISDDNIRQTVEEEISNGKLWPDPLLQFNPSFEKGETLLDLINQGHIHPELDNVFKGYRLYKHQVEALKQGAQGNGFVVVSGTGSGKSLTYISTILNYLFNSNSGKGVKAIIVYPMNALINSQFEEIKKFKEKFKQNTQKEFPIDFKKYTGQESNEEKQGTVRNPPDILLTNYVMLEYILTRTSEENLRNKIFDSLKYLVFDELHTYRGRQGSDVALLVRKLKAQCKNETVCIGTSATMASGASWQEQKATIAKVADDFFAYSFKPEQIIGEHLEKITNSQNNNEALKKCLHEIKSIETPEKLFEHPISIWLEDNVILEYKVDRYFRAKPQTFQEIIRKLADEVACEYSIAENAFLHYLSALEKLNILQGQNDNQTFFAFKIHQFINQTGSVSATLDAPGKRLINLDGLSRTSPTQGNLPFFQLVFSRITGKELYSISRVDATSTFVPRSFNRYVEENEEPNAGYLLIQSKNEESLWDEQRDIEILPENWIRYDRNDNPIIKKEYTTRLPVLIYINNHGQFTNNPKENYFPAWFIPYSSNIDFTSGTVFDTRTKESTMYSSLGVEGRSTSTNVLVFAMIRRMHLAGLQENIQKVLSFTDNRQDTALQSGHFNDFIKVGQLRNAIWKAVRSRETIKEENILESIYSELQINLEDFVKQMVDEGTHKYRENIRALNAALYYKILHDLRRGWRVILPNLEQCGLLKIGYRGIDEEFKKQKWETHPISGRLTEGERKELCFQILDYLRKSSAINHSILERGEIEKNERLLKDTLKSSWLYNPGERIQYPNHARLHTTAQRRANITSISMGSRSGPGRFIKNFLKQAIDFSFNSTDEFNEFMEWLLDELSRSGFLYRDDTILNVPLYQLNGSEIIWQKGDEKTIQPDRVKNPSFLNLTPKVNNYFQDFYKTDFSSLKSLKAGEHSGQLKNDQRIEFEKLFKKGNLSLLCCSPTMELGIDISDLMAVHMRNVPPDPANYAQRSGRAGRSGQAALVFTYCIAASAHDQHYFQNRIEMVAGIVQAPKLDFSNEDLIRGHFYSLYLAEAGISELNSSLKDLVNEMEGPDWLKLSTIAISKLSLRTDQIDKLVGIGLKIIKDLKEKDVNHEWLNEAWIRKQLGEVPQRFDFSMERWRQLYKNAKATIQRSSLIENDVTIPATDERKRNAGRDKRLAQNEIDLLRNVPAYGKERQTDQSEFYPYRYLASEGFLPGFGFTRLPVRVFVPHNEGQYIGRPRNLAIREFAPLNSLYYMGNKYQIKRMQVNDLDEKIARLKISRATGYLLSNKNGDYENSVDPFDNIDLSNDNARELLHEVLQLSETRAEEMGRITCEEEERLREGFEIETYFSMKGNLKSIKKLKVYSGSDELLEISYLPATTLYKLNRKWKTADTPGFIMEELSGIWKKPGFEATNNNSANPVSIKRVMLYTDHTADALYIKPLKNLSTEAHRTVALTLMFALKRAIENLFQVESREIGAELMGLDDEPNILIYEAAEGSLGILKMLVKEPDKFKELVHEAWKICHFDIDEKEQEKFGVASYQDLLSYFNQFYHQEIDRYKIKTALQSLMQAQYTALASTAFDTYDLQYEYLMAQVDPKSTTEAALLKFLYKNGLRLPDRNQVNLQSQGCHTIPDFLYENEVQAVVYCDGIHHDTEQAKIFDAQKRACVENLGYEVIVWHYLTPLEDLVKNFPHIFSKAKA